MNPGAATPRGKDLETMREVLEIIDRAAAALESGSRRLDSMAGSARDARMATILMELKGWQDELSSDLRGCRLKIAAITGIIEGLT